MRRIGEGVLVFERAPAVLSHGAVGGRKEAEGPLGSFFDNLHRDDSRLGKDSWEQAEAALQEEAYHLALGKAGMAGVELLFAGDLLNQCIASTFGLVQSGAPFLGQYGACSTMAQTALMAAVAVESGMANTAAAVTSSHFCTAERQFRTPLEYGAQRSPTAQWTATAAGCLILGREEEGSSPVRVTGGLAGRIQDLGVTDPANMGAAMAPAACDSILRYLRGTGTSPADYDGIFTGDLGEVGSQLLLQLLGDEGVRLEAVHRDCGLLLYDQEKQDVHAGGSGCGCSASVLCGRLLRELEARNLRKILFCATGALLSTTSQQQGLSIPGICHIVEFTAG